MTDEQQESVDALMELLMWPVVNEFDPGCCPFTVWGLRRLHHRNPQLYSVVGWPTTIHGWPTDFSNMSRLDGGSCPMPWENTEILHPGRTSQARRRHSATCASLCPAANQPLSR